MRRWTGTQWRLAHDLPARDLIRPACAALPSSSSPSPPSKTRSTRSSTQRGSPCAGPNGHASPSGGALKSSGLAADRAYVSAPSLDGIVRLPTGRELSVDNLGSWRTQLRKGARSEVGWPWRGYPTVIHAISATGGRIAPVWGVLLLFVLWRVWCGSNVWRCVFLGQALLGFIIFVTQLGSEQRIGMLAMCYGVQVSVMLTPAVKAWIRRHGDLVAPVN